MISEQLLKEILEQYPLTWDGVHGVSHWARVLENGRKLAPLTGANITVVELFAVLHDAKRNNEGFDFVHAPAGAKYAAELRGSVFQLDETDFSLLYQACRDHTKGFTHADITVQTCWDADRLDLSRVGIIPKPKRLCTDAAKDPGVIAWALERATARAIPALVKVEWGIELNRGSPTP